ncbi:MAG: hypothetical protein GF355_07090, partial [Candidatus Eisenbacteria bacterium]|nr:hypothetical protein [Candidatus Eisenbacteria bacterium]
MVGSPKPLRRRLLLWAAAGCLFVLVARAVQIQLVEHRTLGAAALMQQCDTLTLPAMRGALYDRHGHVLAQSLENPSLWADPAAVEDPAALDRYLVQCGFTASGEVADRIRDNAHRRFLWLHRGWASPALADEAAGRWAGVGTRLEPKRLCPAAAVLGPLLGRVGRDGAGLTGLEYELNDRLQGRAGCELTYTTGGLKPCASHPPKTLTPPVAGHDIDLTIDLRVQEILLRRLREGLLRWEASAVFGLILDPLSGEILAAASIPHPDSSLWRGSHAGPRRMRPFCDQWEPGSTFKVVTYAAALEAGLVGLDEPIDCEEGEWATPDWTIGDHEPFGILSITDALVHSSNVAAAKVALRAGPERFYRMMRHMGFGLSTGVGFPGEARGRVLPPEEWNRRSLPTMGFG